MAFAICGTETVTIKAFFLFWLWQGLTFALMFHSAISTNIVNKKGNFRIKCKFFHQIIAINIVIVVGIPIILG